ncbi:hypothetical protein ACFQYP_29820 [Nonomuraea antimicrobica]
MGDRGDGFAVGEQEQGVVQAKLGAPLGKLMPSSARHRRARVRSLVPVRAASRARVLLSAGSRCRASQTAARRESLAVGRCRGCSGARLSWSSSTASSRARSLPSLPRCPCQCPCPRPSPSCACSPA